MRKTTKKTALKTCWYTHHPETHQMVEVVTADYARKLEERLEVAKGAAAAHARSAADTIVKRLVPDANSSHKAFAEGVIEASIENYCRWPLFGGDIE